MFVFLLSVFLLGTITTESETPNSMVENTLNVILQILDGLDLRMVLMKGKISPITGMTINMKGRLNSTNSIPQNYHAFSNGHTQKNTSTTITPNIFCQICNPPLQDNVSNPQPLATKMFETPFDHSNPNLTKYTKKIHKTKIYPIKYHKKKTKIH